jgi:two-component system, response regulator PdtaR
VSGAPASEGRVLRLVVAEDEPIIRLDLVECLLDEGYDVVASTGRGDEVLGLVEQHRPDLVILDIRMPGIDGIEAADLITERRLAGVVILTAYSQRDLITRATDAGALGYLVKPWQRHDLIPAIEIAHARFLETLALADEAAELGERLEARKLIDRAKGLLMDEHGMSEAAAFRFVQTTAMADRRSMREVAAEVLDRTVVPDPAAAD